MPEQAPVLGRQRLGVLNPPRRQAADAGFQPLTADGAIEATERFGQQVEAIGRPHLSKTLVGRRLKRERERTVRDGPRKGFIDR
jgi:hypothetical protein